MAKHLDCDLDELYQGVNDVVKLVVKFCKAKKKYVPSVACPLLTPNDL